MNVEKPTRVQLMVAWRDHKWVVSRDSQEVAAYAFRSAAMDAVRSLSGAVADEGRNCYLLIRERDGSWQERPCPKPLQKRA